MPKSSKKMRELTGFLLLVFTVAILLSLVTYHPGDPPRSTAPQSKNLMGNAGALFAEMCFRYLGVGAFFLLFPPAIFTLRLLFGRPSRRLFSGYCAFFLTLLPTSSLCQLWADAGGAAGRGLPGSLLTQMPGGILGLAIIKNLESLLNPTGTIILLVTALVFGLLLLTPLTFSELWPASRRLFARRSGKDRKPVPPAQEKAEKAGPLEEEAEEPPVEDIGDRTLHIDPVPIETSPARPAYAPRPVPAPPAPAPVPAPAVPTPPSAPAPVPAPALARTARETAESFAEKQMADKSFADKPFADRSLPDRPAADKPFTDRSFVEKPPATPPVLAPVLREKPLDVAKDILPDLGSPAPFDSRSGFRLPTSDLLSAPAAASKVGEAELMEKAGQIVKKLSEFGLEGCIEKIHPGPVVTLFEYQPAPGVKYSRILSLTDDLCLGLMAESIRIDRIPGKSTVGIEVPNARRDVISIRDILESPVFLQSSSRLTMALGKKINGEAFVTDLSKMPHLLVAGATGQGKSVGLNTMITSILFKSTPEEVKFIFIDPKRIELGMYADIPHLLTPIVTDSKLAAGALIWAVHEMEERYKLLARYKVKDIGSYNHYVEENQPLPVREEENSLRKIPYIVIVIDELADLLAVASKEVELCLQRLAQMARAVGIHIIMATQRPSVEVVTGTIKANFPSRISFRLLSKHDSKTILDQVGAEHLLGKGDMLILPPNTAKLLRVHGAFISEEETKRVVEFLKGQAEPVFQSLRTGGGEEGEEADDGGGEGGSDPLYEEVARFIVKQRKASTSILQRRFRVGYGRAARLMDMLEEEGVVGPADGSRPRDVLVPADYYDSVDETHDPDA